MQLIIYNFQNYLDTLYKYVALLIYQNVCYIHEVILNTVRLSPTGVGQDFRQPLAKKSKISLFHE